MSRLARALAVAAAISVATPAAAQAPLVYAAASLTDALEEIAAKLPLPARFSFAASSILARQIENGAPADIFASADEDWADHLAARGRLVPGSRVSILSNRLVLIVPADRPQDIVLARGMDFGTLLGRSRLATGDPAHVPVGRYARSAFEWLGVWPDVEPRLARAASVRAALALVERGDAPLGVVYATDAAQSPRVVVAATFPAGSHPAISYPFSIVAGRDGPAARAFLAGVRSPAALAIFRRHGFTVD